MSSPFGVSVSYHFGHFQLGLRAHFQRLHWLRLVPRPKRCPAADNAIDCACALYMDVVNLFIHLLRIFEKK